MNMESICENERYEIEKKEIQNIVEQDSYNQDISQKIQIATSHLLPIDLNSLNIVHTLKDGKLQFKKLSEMSNTYQIHTSTELGSGFASVVYLGQNIKKNQIVCIKVVDLHILASQKESLHREIKYLKKFDSENIVKIYEVYESSSFYYLIMEYCPCGDLYKFILREPQLSPTFAARFIEQICYGLLELKKKGLIHRDLKTQNIFLGERLKAKIGDLGFCVSVNDQKINNNVGSPIYMSPQVLASDAHTFQSDIYGLGIIWYELLHKRAPWQAISQEQLILKKLNDPLIFYRQDIPEKHKELISRCLDKDPKKRCSIDSLIDYFACNSPEQELKRIFLSKNSLQNQRREFG